MVKKKDTTEVTLMQFGQDIKYIKEGVDRNYNENKEEHSLIKKTLDDHIVTSKIEIEKKADKDEVMKLQDRLWYVLITLVFFLVTTIVGLIVYIWNSHIF
jgi:hypothetical protein